MSESTLEASVHVTYCWVARWPVYTSELALIIQSPDGTGAVNNLRTVYFSVAKARIEVASAVRYAMSLCYRAMIRHSRPYNQIRWLFGAIGEYNTIFCEAVDLDALLYLHLTGFDQGCAPYVNPCPQYERLCVTLHCDTHRTLS